MIVIPENILYNELEVLIKHVWASHSAFAAQGGVTNASAGTSGFTVAVTQNGAVGVAEITQIDTVADVSGSLGNKFIELNTPSSNWYFWFNTGTDTDPAIPSKAGVRVMIAANATDEQVATALAAAINLYPLYFRAVVDGAEVIVTNVETDARRRSPLWAMFGSNQLDRLNYYDQMVDMLEDRYNKRKRPFDIYLGWNPERTSVPAISIMLPNEEHGPKDVSIDMQHVDLGFGGLASVQKQARYTTTYDLLVTSDNETEVILLYHFLKTLVLIGIEQFQLTGLENMSISGRDITTDFEVMPRMMYHRTVGLTFYYENKVPSLESFTNATLIAVNGSVVSVNPVSNYATIVNGAGTVLRIVQMGEIANLGYILFTDSDGQTYNVPVGANVTATYAPPVYEARSDSDWPIIYQGSAPVGTLETASIWVVYRFTYTAPDTDPIQEVATGQWSDRVNLNYN